MKTTTTMTETEKSEIADAIRTDWSGEYTGEVVVLCTQQVAGEWIEWNRAEATPADEATLTIAEMALQADGMPTAWFRFTM